ncbi:MAG: hypothetical protein CM1200mP16_01570 [Nitrospina sp.]|nr:MAG: hypothetical protein CM1200mP16_01570 [Nitrospina sp.]
MIADEKINKLSAATKELQINNAASRQVLGVLKGITWSRCRSLRS